MSLQMVRFNADPARVPEVQQAINSLFGAVAEAAPTGLAYEAFQVGDSAEFILLLSLTEGVENPLPSIAEAHAFREHVAEWAGAPVPPQAVTVLGRYRG